MGTEPGKRGIEFWSLQLPGWLILIWLAYAQGLSAFSYQLGVKMGTQEPATQITEVGAAFWYGFAFADLVIYIPLLALGLVGHQRRARWWRPVLAAALGITLYWPIVCLAALVDARDAAGWHLTELPYWFVCLGIASWGAWGLWRVLREPVSDD